MFDGPTKRQKRVASLVLVSSSEEHIEACKRCAVELEVFLHTCDLGHAAGQVARWRPFALLVDEAVYEFDPREFNALARDVGASLITLPVETDVGRLARDLMPALKSARQQHPLRH